MSPKSIAKFQECIYRHYRAHGRILPWRRTTNPYHILVSEIMLQQTQVERVIPKYEQFVKTFPDFKSVVSAQLDEVLKAWQGLGYNRRAIALKKIAQIVVDELKGTLPPDWKSLMTMPGIGRATASAICAFAFDMPVVFIETNVRAVYIHFFFSDQEEVTDRELYPLVEETLDRTNPREWYYALMDYGVMLKKSLKNPNRKSVHHKKQKPFKGSNRQLRGNILKIILENPTISESELLCQLGGDSQSVSVNLSQLEREGFFERRDGHFFIHLE